MTRRSTFHPDTVKTAFGRAGQRCERCGKGPLDWNDRGWSWSAQHRVARGMGGRSLRLLDLLSGVAYCAILCGSATTGCHNDVENVNRLQAYDDGFALRMGETPETVPLRHWQHGMVILTPDGGYTEAAAA